MVERLSKNYRTRKTFRLYSGGRAIPERFRSDSAPRFNEQRLGGTPRPTEPQTRKVQNMRKIKIMLSAWGLVASGQWLVASAVLPMLGVRAPYVGGTLSLRWRGALGDRALPSPRPTAGVAARVGVAAR